MFESNDSSGLSRWEYKIFSASVRCRSGPKTLRTSLSLLSNLGYGGVRERTFCSTGELFTVARVRLCKTLEAEFCNSFIRKVMSQLILSALTAAILLLQSIVLALILEELKGKKTRIKLFSVTKNII